MFLNIDLHLTIKNRILYTKSENTFQQNTVDKKKCLD